MVETTSPPTIVNQFSLDEAQMQKLGFHLSMQSILRGELQKMSDGSYELYVEYKDPSGHVSDSDLRILNPQELNTKLNQLGLDANFQPSEQKNRTFTPP